MNRLAWVLAFGSGFLSLSEEILWVRFVGFVQLGVPHAFALVLSLYLLGIALGAAMGKRLCQSALDLRVAVAVVLAVAAALGLALPWLLAMVGESDPLLRFAVPLALLVLSSSLKAVVFPVAHHLGSRVDGAGFGRSLSSVYGMNIAGSTLGPLLTGFVLLDHLSIDAGFRWIGVGCLALAAAAVWPQHRRWTVVAVAVGFTVGMQIDPQANQVLAMHAARPQGAAVGALISNRHGVIHTVSGDTQGDIVYGGNVYDGRTNVDLRINSNRIDRAYLLAALHPQPKRVLVIGLSTGAWLRVLSALPTVDHIDVVEINPGYLALIPRYPQLATLLDDARVKFHIDDGRRWLRRHPAERFDLIVMNTTFHWRANVTNLVSRQFLELARDRLAPGGLLAYNGTGSPDVFRTAAAVFAHSYQWGNFVYAAGHDFGRMMLDPAAAQRIADVRPAGPSRSLQEQTAYEAAARMLLRTPLTSLAQVEAVAGRPLEVIDDSTMPTEFRFGRGLVLE